MNIKRINSRVYNLKIRVYKYLIDNNFDFDKSFTKNELENEYNLFFRQIDFLYIRQLNFMALNDDKYQINQSLEDEFNIIKENYQNKLDFDIIKSDFTNACEKIKSALKYENSPIVPEIAKKYLNTLEYLNATN